MRQISSTRTRSAPTALGTTVGNSGRVIRNDKDTQRQFESEDVSGLDALADSGPPEVAIGEVFRLLGALGGVDMSVAQETIGGTATEVLDVGATARVEGLVFEDVAGGDGTFNPYVFSQTFGLLTGPYMHFRRHANIDNDPPPTAGDTTTQAYIGLVIRALILREVLNNGFPEEVMLIALKLRNMHFFGNGDDLMLDILLATIAGVETRQIVLMPESESNGWGEQFIRIRHSRIVSQTADPDVECVDLLRGPGAAATPYHLQNYAGMRLSVLEIARPLRDYGYTRIRENTINLGPGQPAYPVLDGLREVVAQVFTLGAENGGTGYFFPSGSIDKDNPTAPTNVAGFVHGDGGAPVNMRTATRVYYDGGVMDMVGAGDPEGVVEAPVGSTYRCTSGTGFYYKETGLLNTGWKKLAYVP
jgi:hypothetical protein